VNATLRHEIDAACQENDLDALFSILLIHERDDNVRAVVYAGIDRVCANLGCLVTADVIVLN